MRHVVLGVVFFLATVFLATVFLGAVVLGAALPAAAAGAFVAGAFVVAAAGFVAAGDFDAVAAFFAVWALPEATANATMATIAAQGRKIRIGTV